MENEISIEPFPYRVRMLAMLIFSSDGINGCVNAVRMLLRIFLSEALMGWCKRIDVRILKDSSIEIVAYDRGFALDESGINGKPRWYYQLCEFFSGPREADKYQALLGLRHNELYGSAEKNALRLERNEDDTMGLCCVQCASEFMEVESVHNGVRKKLYFEKGYNVGDMEKAQTTEPSYTKIYFKPSSDVFSNTDIPKAAISVFLKTVAIPGLVCTLKDERIGSDECYCYDEAMPE